MEYINFLKQDMMTQCRLANEIMATEPFIRQLYDDICATLGCFKPYLHINQFGSMQYLETGDIYFQPGIYYPPSAIMISLIDLYMIAYEHGKYLNISMDDSYKAEAAHTILHELSHSMQVTSGIDTAMGAALEWVNEKNTWDKLYPMVDTMLKRKYKIKLFEQTIDDSVGRVYSYNYKSSDDYTTVVRFMLSCFAPNPVVIDRFANELNEAIDISVNLTYFGIDYLGIEIKKNGVINYDNCAKLRKMFDLPYSVFSVKFNATDLRNNNKYLVLNLILDKPIEKEIFYDTNSDDFSFNPEYCG